MNVLTSTTNASDDEILKYGTDEQIRERFAQLCGEIDEKRSGLTEMDRQTTSLLEDIERMEEQIECARKLVRAIERSCRGLWGAEALKDVIKRLIDESSFER